MHFAAIAEPNVRIFAPLQSHCGKYDQNIAQI